MLMLGCVLTVASVANAWEWPGRATKIDDTNKYWCDASQYRTCVRSIDATDKSASVGDKVELIIGNIAIPGTVVNKPAPTTVSITLNIPDVDGNTSVEVSEIAY